MDLVAWYMANTELPTFFFTPRVFSRLNCQRMWRCLKAEEIYRELERAFLSLKSIFCCFFFLVLGF